jgi:hypothetical protein
MEVKIIAIPSYREFIKRISSRDFLSLITITRNLVFNTQIVLCAGVPEAGVLPELRRFFTSRSRSCCAFFPTPAGKLE